MPMTETRWARIKTQVKLWHVMEPEHLDKEAAEAVILEMRNVIEEIMTAAEEPDTPVKVPWWRKLFGGRHGN